MNTYLKPSLKFLNSFNGHFVAVTQSGLSDLQLINDTGFSNCGQTTDENDIEFCLSGSNDISSDLNGLIITAGEQQFELANCVSQGTHSGTCSGTYYFCHTVEASDHPLCVQSIAINGGATLTHCASIDGTCDTGV